MYVIEQPAPVDTPIPGVRHATWGGRAEGLTALSLWRQSLVPGGATPPHSHPCDEAVLCLAGQGEVEIEGQRHAFGPGQTVVLPAGVLHQIFNTGDATLECTAVFSATPVPVTLPDGSPLELPWRT
ncbi:MULTISPECIES: cupin domain-containing protein [Ramlibacter]|uniref:Cupin domain-containing protein n=1 Tax=Ramlibacter pinisoli TaxID=2682844 RepID=A0A6N8IRU8_9BURK|nr:MULTISPECIES: cupin domain-containing protein [Ramlibacter]MBA2963984.1 cupin domain-containing protein [Ramlibacter sp. CGMCC 1.13660]MVQ28950.1 cupin domain-containing protein [Ramlibacter pinisoli]